MKKITILLISIFLGLNLFGQSEKKIIIKKEKKVVVDKDQNDASITVEVEAEDDNRRIVIKTIKDGEEKVLEWKDDGEIPEEIKKELEENDIDIHVIESGEDGEIKIEKEHVFIMKHGDSDAMEIEWDGEGEMPEGLKKMMNEHDIDLDEIKKGAKGKKMKMKMLKRDGHDKGPHKMHYKGLHKGDKAHWTKKRNKMSDTYIGAQIATAESGVEIIDVMVDSPAHKAGLKKGDIINEINAANTKNVDDMMTLLSFFDVDDMININFTREGKYKSTKVKLAKRPQPYR